MATTDGSTRGLGSAPYVLSVLLLLDAAVACAVSLFRPDLLHGPAVSIGNLRGTALTVLVVALPVLALSMVAVRRGRPLGLAGWIGAIAYTGYQGGLFLMGTPFNGLFLLYVGIAGLAVWSAIALVPRTPLGAYAAMFGPRLRARLVAGWLVLLAAAFYVLWLRAIVPALFASDAPAFLAGTGMTTGPAQVLDLAFFLPLTLLGAALVWRRHPWGLLLAGALLVQSTIESVSVAADQWMGSAADPASPVSSAAMAPVFLVLAAIGLAVIAVYRQGTKPSAARTAGVGAVRAA
jgi:hypothetical protein